MMISDTPLPMPRLVICSPSHIRNSVPAVKQTIVLMMNSGPGATTGLACAAISWVATP